MPLTYHIYWNGGQGGPVDYSTPLAGTTGLTFAPAPLAAPSDTTFAVRALDPATNLEEANTDARVRVVVDAGGNDVSGAPNPPHSLTAVATAAGGCRVVWAYSPSGQGGAPSGFHVYLGPGAAPNYASPAATVAYAPGQSAFACDLSGLADGVSYSVGVRSYNAAATEGNTSAVVTVTGDTSFPDDVDSLGAAVV